MVRKHTLRTRGSRQRIAAILAGLDRAFPEPKIALDHRNPFELLIATILSAQCTDERVNTVTRDLFRKYPSPRDLAVANLSELEEDVRPTGFYRNKARSIQSASRMILDKFGGAVPETMEQLVQLPGVARKTANVVLGASFGKAEGIVVDTHVARVSGRLDLTSAIEPEEIERDLMRLVPKDRWISFSLRTILHGRHVCKARKPLCHVCSVEKLCTSRDKMRAFPPARPVGIGNRKSKR